MSIRTKQELIEYLKSKYNNDSRITETTMFKADNEMTDDAFTLVKALERTINWKGNTETLQVFNIPVKLFPFCLSKSDYKSPNGTRYGTALSKEWFEYKKAEYKTKVLPRLEKKVKEFVENTGCFYIYPVLTESYTDNDQVVLYLCSENLVALELFESLQEKVEYILGE